MTLVVSANELTSLKGAPQKVGGDFICDDNKLTSLEGAPQKVDGNFTCSNNQLTSLKGAPKEVGGDFDYISNTKLTNDDYEWLKQNSDIEGEVIK